MSLPVVNGMTFAAPWQQGVPDSIEVLTPTGERRVIHAIRSAPPDERWCICEWSNARERYEAPVEAPPAGLMVAPIHGSQRGDTGWVLPGAKHGGVHLRTRTRADGSRVIQVLYTSRWPSSVSGDPYWLVAPVTLPILTVDALDWESVALTLQTEIDELRRSLRTLLGLESRVDAVERALGTLGENGNQTLESRLTTLEGRVQAAGEAMREG